MDSLAQQVVYKRKSLTVDEANVFQIDGELQSHNSCDLQHSRMSLFDGSKSLKSDLKVHQEVEEQDLAFSARLVERVHTQCTHALTRGLAPRLR